MSNSDTKQLTQVAQVDVRSAWASQINWGEAIKVICAIAAIKGISVPVEIQNDILLTIISVGAVYTWVVKTWFSKTITRGSAASPSVPVSTVMRALVFALLLSSLFALAPGVAIAADIATKAPAFAAAPVAGCTSTGCSGAFLGAEVSGSGTGVNVLNLGSLNAGGTSMGIAGGYQFYNGAYWLGALAKVDYEVGSPAGSLAPGGLSNLFAFEGVEIGGNVAGLFGITAINLPGFLASAVPTVLIGACQRGAHLSGYCAGAAAHFFVPNSRWTIDVDYLNAQYGATQIAPNASANVENRGTFGFRYHF